MKQLDQLKIVEISDMPVGFCRDCLEALKNGEATFPFYLELPGTQLMWVGGYCVHRRVAGFTIVEPGAELKWTLVGRSEIDDVLPLMKNSMAMFVGALKAQQDMEAERRGQNH